MQELIQDWGYIVLFGYSFGGGFFALAVAGVLSFAGELNIYTTIVVALSANFIGDQFLFMIAKNNKEYAKKLMKNHQRKIAYSQLLMRKYGPAVILLQKYIYGVKTLVPLAMGLTKYDVKKFAVYNFIGAVIWAVVIGTLAYILGELVYTYVEDFKTYGMAFIVVLLLFIAYMFRKI